MRLVKLGIRDVTIDLHPRLSVLTGLGAASRAALLEALRALPQGRAVAGGVVEAHDVLFDLTDEVLDLFELSAPEVDPVVVADDVEHHTSGAAVEGATLDEAAVNGAGEGAAAKAAVLEEQLAVLEVPDPAPLQAALEQLEAAPAPVVSPDAESLTAELVRLDERARALDAVASAPGVATVDAARDRVEQARAELVAAQRAAGPGHDPDLVAELEAAHHELVEATEALGARFGRRRAEHRVEAARAREDAALHALGLVSYTDFHLGVLHRQPGVGHASRIAAAEQDLADAEQALADLEAGADEVQSGLAEADSARREVLRERERLLERVADVLGHVPGPDPVADLRAHRVGGPEHAAARQALVDALVAVGVALDAAAPGGGDGAAALTDDELLALARSWLHEAAQADAHAQVAAEALAHLRSGGSGPADPPPQPPDAGPPDEARLVEELEWYLLARLAGQRSVSYVGSVPLLLDRVLDGLPPGVAVGVLERLESVSESVQLIVLSEDPAVVAWAEARDASEVALVTAGRGD